MYQGVIWDNLLENHKYTTWCKSEDEAKQAAKEKISRLCNIYKIENGGRFELECVNIK